MSLTAPPPSPQWTPDHGEFRDRLTRWWQHKGPALWINAPADEPWEHLAPPPPEPADARGMWTDVPYRVENAIWQLAHRCYYGTTFPFLDTQIGPGSLGTFIGSEPRFRPDTVWYEPNLTDDDVLLDTPIRFDPTNPWFRLHQAFIVAAQLSARGRFLVGIPDLIENIDTLAQLRGPQPLLMDMVDQPEWVERRLWEINEVYFAAFNLLVETIHDESGGNAFAAFGLWGPGRTAKVQCDACAMFSPQMFRQFVLPPLSEQCRWLDYSMFHLDGTACLDCLDDVLSIDSLDALEWTPEPRVPSGGNPHWYPTYRKILAAGKSVQAIQVAYDEVLPLFDAIGTEGVYVMTSAPSESAAAKLAEAVFG